MADQTPEVQSAPDNQQLQTPTQAADKISLTPAPKAPPSAIDQETQLPQPGTPAGMSEAGMGQPAPANVPAKPGTPEARQQHHGVLGEIFQTLAGGKKAVWKQDAAGNPVKTYEDLKPGEMAMGILAAAVTGMAGGYAAKTGGGPAGKARAFSAGFQAEQQAADKKEAKGAEEAQQEFKNRNISDEKKLLIERNVREQQKSISDLQTADIERQSMSQNIRQGKEIFDNKMLDDQIKRGADWNSYMNSGFTEMPHPTEEGKNFGFATYKDASEAGNAHPEMLAGLPDHNTIIAYNPATGLFVPLMKPKGYDEKAEMRFGKPDPKHKGQWLPTGQKDETGQVIQPQMMTGADYQSRIAKLDAHASSKATAAEKYAIAAKYNEEMQANKDVKLMNSRLADAGNNPYAVDIDTANWMLNGNDRAQLQNLYMTAGAKYAASAQSYASDLQKGFANPADEAVARDQMQKALEMTNMYKQKLAELGSNVDRSTALGASFVQKFTHDGKFDADKALEHFDDNIKKGKYAVSGLTKDDLNAARDYVVKQQQAVAAAKAAKEAKPTTKEAATQVEPNKLVYLQDPSKLQAAKANIQDLTKAGKTEDQIVEEINNSQSLAPGDKTFLINEMKGLNDVRPGMTMMKDPKTNKTINVSNDDTAQWQQKGYQVVGQGTAGNQIQISGEAEREK